MRAFLIAATIAAFLVVTTFIVQAFAAEGSLPATSLLEPIRPYLVEVFGALILAFVTWLSSWLRATFKVSLDEAHRAALHSALENGARLALERLDEAAASTTIETGSPLIATGVEYVFKYSPDAVAYFGLTPERVGELLRAKLKIAAA